MVSFWRTPHCLAGRGKPKGNQPCVFLGRPELVSHSPSAWGVGQNTPEVGGEGLVDSTRQLLPGPVTRFNPFRRVGLFQGDVKQTRQRHKTPFRVSCKVLTIQKASPSHRPGQETQAKPAPVRGKPDHRPKWILPLRVNLSAARKRRVQFWLAGLETFMGDVAN